MLRETRQADQIRSTALNAFAQRRLLASTPARGNGGVYIPWRAT